MQLVLLLVYHLNLRLEEIKDRLHHHYSWETTVYKQRVAVVLYMGLKQQSPSDVRGYITHLLESRFTWLASFLFASSSISIEQNREAGQLVAQALQ
jgi:hypothetical protein